MYISGDPPMRLLLAFQEHFPEFAPTWVLQAPGRDMWVAASLIESTALTLVAPDFDAHTTFSYRSAKTRLTVLNRPLPNWARYPVGVLLALRDQGMETTGLQAVLAGGEPQGPRYEHAMGIAIAALWHEIHGRPHTTHTLIDLVEQVRREYVET